MAKNTNKTIETKESVPEFVATIKDEKKRSDFSAIVKLLARHTGFKPKMWGNAIVGFGSYHYKYDSGREGDAPLAALSPRANSITLYFSGAKGKPELLKKFGKHKMSGSCIHIQKLEDVDTAVMTKLADHSIKYLKNLYPE